MKSEIKISKHLKNMTHRRLFELNNSNLEMWTGAKRYTL